MDRLERIDSQVAEAEVAAFGVAEHRPSGVTLGQHALSVLLQPVQVVPGKVNPPAAFLYFHILDAQGTRNLFQGLPHQ